LRGNPSVDEAEHRWEVGADLSAVAESPAKFEARPLSRRGVKVGFRRSAAIHRDEGEGSLATQSRRSLPSIAIPACAPFPAVPLRNP